MKQVLTSVLILLTCNLFSQEIEHEKIQPINENKVTKIRVNMIGTQVWMTKNLDVSTFRNGDPIPEAKTDDEWKLAGENKQPAWCYYNGSKNGQNNGKLYNWYAVSDMRGLAPLGYHVPNESEWILLLSYLDGKSDDGIKSNRKHARIRLKNSGFSVSLAGIRSTDGVFELNNLRGCWWSISVNNFVPLDDRAWAALFDFEVGSVKRDLKLKGYGFSVRCLKD
jgi:uncharacterized protein (TIGR02145 family)